MIIYPTTNSGYGISKNEELCTEESPLNPISLYGKSKCEAEKLVLDSGNGITFRLATVFGMSPQMRLDLIVNDFVYRAIKDGFIVLYESHFKRNYIHVYDIANVFLFCIKNTNKTNNEIFNVGLSDTNISKLELCQRIKRIVPNLNIIESQFKKDPDQRDYFVSNKKIEKKGFKPKYHLSHGIKEMVKIFSNSDSKYNNNY